MRKAITKVLTGLVCFLVTGSGVARAQQEGAAMTAPALNQELPTPQAVQPTTPVPVQMPPAPPAEPPPPPVENTQPPAQQVTAPVSAPQPQQQIAGGQWVYTSQYGWIWMPYGTQYTYEGAGDNQAQPYSYVYYPTYGWTWLVAPWVWGWGSYPYFGIGGSWRFAWYRGLYEAGYGWGGYRGGFARAYANGYRGGNFRAYTNGYGAGGYGAGSYRGRPVYGGAYAGGNRGYAGSSRGVSPVINGYGRGNMGGRYGGFVGGGHVGTIGGSVRGFPGGSAGSFHGGGSHGGGSHGSGFRGGHR
jgi:hypothetical protein